MIRIFLPDEKKWFFRKWLDEAFRLLYSWTLSWTTVDKHAHLKDQIENANQFSTYHTFPEVAVLSISS